MLDTGLNECAAINQVNNFVALLEHYLLEDNCWVDQPCLNQEIQDFYACLSSEIGVPACKLRAVFNDGLNCYLATVQEFLSEIHEDRGHDGVVKVTSLVKLFSYVLNFLVAYGDLTPDIFRKEEEDLIDTARCFLNSVSAFDMYPEYMRSINTPVFLDRRYNS